MAESVACPDKLQFQAEGCFFDMVNAYNTSVSGLLLYHPHFRNSLDSLNVKEQGRLVGLGSREHSVLEVKPTEIIDLMNKDLISLGKVTDSLAFMLANAAYEAVKDRLSKNNEVHEFLRHFRHGASHGGKWSFKGSEPIHRAEWRGRKITRELQGKRLWDLNMGPGDVLVLLWDIEQSFEGGKQ